MKTKDVYFKEKLTLILSGVAILISIFSMVEVKTDFIYKVSTGMNLVKAGALMAKPATIESLPVDPSEKNNFIILDSANVVYLEYKVIVFYEYEGSLYYFGTPYIFESGKMLILRPNDDQEKAVEEVDLKFSKYDSTRLFEDNIPENLVEISIIYKGYSENDFDMIEIQNSSNSGSDTDSIGDNNELNITVTPSPY